MALRPKLEMRQSQSLVMTPQLQQAIKLLQMSNLELNDYVAAELERNPLLERDDDEQGEEFGADTPPADSDGSDGDATAAGDGDDTFEPDLDLGAGKSDHESIKQLDTEYDNVYSDESRADAQARAPEGPTDSNWSATAGSGGGSFEGGDFDLESTLTREKTLTDHLTEQLNLAIKDPAQRLIGAHLIGMINEIGYLTGNMESVAEQLGASERVVLETLYEMQKFDPPGVFARSLSECLALQLYEQNRLDPAMRIMVDNLELLAKHDFPTLRKLCSVDEEDLFEMVAEIRDLNPKPGNAFGTVIVQPVVPDVFVREGNDGGWIVELNSETLPRILVNNAYHATVNRSATREEDKTYISECYANANWLARSLDQRARTILKVSRELVRQQDGFFAYGIDHLRPLNLRTIADAIEMHESTVSRVTANKYIATPRGIFEMKYFFTSAISSAEGGEAHAAESVRHRIKDLIDAEVNGEILSDDKIVDILRGQGIDIARRTVAKYREALGIPSSVQRRRAKRAFA
jgi:RNA polymerase sigma-54 factor